MISVIQALVPLAACRCRCQSREEEAASTANRDARKPFLSEFDARHEPITHEWRCDLKFQDLCIENPMSNTERLKSPILLLALQSPRSAYIPWVHAPFLYQYQTNHLGCSPRVFKTCASTHTHPDKYLVREWKDVSSFDRRGSRGRARPPVYRRRKVGVARSLNCGFIGSGRRKMARKYAISRVLDCASSIVRVERCGSA
jgi:hypothetical protein